MHNIKKLIALLSSRERKNLYLLFIMTILMAVIDTLGVASILPFVAVLSNPTIIETNFILNNFFLFLNDYGIENNLQFLLVLGVIVFVLLIFSLIFKIVTQYIQLRFVQMREYSISKKLAERYVKQSYSWFLNRNSADLGKNILSEVNIIINNGIKQLIELISKFIIVILLAILLTIVNSKLTFLIIFSLGGIYLIIFFLTKTYLKKIGAERLKNNNLRFLALSETFGAIKEIKVATLEEICIKNFSKYAKIFAKTQVLAQLIILLPRYILEAISFGGILLVILYNIEETNSFSNSLPIISLYVFAGYRMMPAMQQIFSSFASLAFIGPTLKKLHDDIRNLKTYDKPQSQSLITFNKAINLKNIYFHYPNEMQMFLKDVNLCIPAKSTIGFVGSTGSGKTTIVDIILGLLEPKKGTLEVDGKTITRNNVRTWQQSIGYVPQSIFLSDDTVAANIAFGSEAKEIDNESLIYASRIANLHEFVTSKLPKQYQTIIGERGARLSGGQRQRIGIARALYKRPDLLILDEATSALDNSTEKIVMDAVKALDSKMTIIIIAHRLNTVKDCDIVFKFDKGQLIKQGKFNEIFIKNDNND